MRVPAFLYQGKYFFRWNDLYSIGVKQPGTSRHVLHFHPLRFAEFPASLSCNKPSADRRQSTRVAKKPLSGSQGQDSTLCGQSYSDAGRASSEDDRDAFRGHHEV